MKNTFVCPHCQGVLNPNVKILLVADTSRARGLVLLSPQPGNYKYLCDSSLEGALQPGETITFSCPLCQADLVSASDPQLAQLELHVPSHEPRRVEFSRVFGTHATFIINGGEVDTYGKDADDFDALNFFGS
jgi:hypothetical protein